MQKEILDALDKGLSVYEGTVAFDEAARWSAYITPDLKMLPCSFDNQSMKWAVDLRERSIAEAWESAEFNDFRHRLKMACPTCDMRESCMGGCTICPEIVLCDKFQQARLPMGM